MGNVATITPQPAQQIVDTRYTQDVIPVLDTSKFEHMQRIAIVMAHCKYVPADLIKDAESAVSNCFLVVNQAVRWGMDPFALAQSSYFVSGKIGFDGKAVAAAINSDPRLKGRLDYAFEGHGDAMKVTVSGTFKDSGETKTISGTVAQWKTSQGLWGKDPEQALVYRGSRQWARRWMPDRLMGVYSNDELDDMLSRDVPAGQRALHMKDITPKVEALEIPDVPDASPAEVVAEKEPEDVLADPDGFIARLEEQISLCDDAEELAGIAESNADMIARLPESHRAKAAKMLKEAAE
jgi:hypothetical protein